MPQGGGHAQAQVSRHQVGVRATRSSMLRTVQRTGAQGHVVAAHRHHQDVLRGDVVVDEGVLGEQSAPAAAAEGCGFYGGVDAGPLAALPSRRRLAVQPVRDILLHDRRPKHCLVAVERCCRVIKPVFVSNVESPGCLE